MARKNSAVETDEVDNTDEKESGERRRQSPLTRLKFALNNLIGIAIESGLEEVPEVYSAKNLLEDLGFELRASTVVTAQKIIIAMQSLDPMNDLTPRRIKKLGQLLGKAQKGELITEERIEEAAGGDVDFGDDSDESDESDESESNSDFGDNSPKAADAVGAE